MFDLERFTFDCPGYLAFLFSILLLGNPGICQEPIDNSEILAKVGQTQISRGQVRRLLTESTRNLPDADADLPFDDGQIQVGLQQCIDREIVLQHLDTTKHATGKSETRIQMEAVKAQLKQTEQTTEDWLEAEGISEMEFVREIQWRNSWRSFAVATLTRSYLKKQFATKHQPKRLRLSQS